MVVAGGRDVAGALELEDRDAEVAQGGHDLRAVAGAGLGGVFAVGGVADVLRGSPYCRAMWRLSTPGRAFATRLGRCGARYRC